MPEESRTGEAKLGCSELGLSAKQGLLAELGLLTKEGLLTKLTLAGEGAAAR